MTRAAVQFRGGSGLTCFPSQLGRFKSQIEKRKDPMKKEANAFAGSTNRRTFLKRGTVAAGAATVGAGLLADGLSAFGQTGNNTGPGITRGDIAILTFLSALEQGEADLWIQYSEFGGASKQRVSPGA